MKILSRIVKPKASLLTSVYRSFSSKNNLLNAFSSEIEYEEKEFKPISKEEKQAFFDNSGFKFIEAENSARLQLQKTVGDFEVKICYFARSPLPEDQEDNQESEGPAHMTDFQVLIHKKGKNSGFLVEAVVMDSQVNINHVHVSDNLHDFHTKFLSGTIDADVYQGPDFSTLDENLQTAFGEFFTDLGINEETASFIEMSSLDKDQSLYMNWLRNAKNNLV